MLCLPPLRRMLHSSMLTGVLGPSSTVLVSLTGSFLPVPDLSALAPVRPHCCEQQLSLGALLIIVARVAQMSARIF